MATSSSDSERLEILRYYRRLIEVWYTRKDTLDRWMVRKAFRLAADAHKDMRRRSGEPFILHPISVAIIAAGEIGLGKTSIIAALLHDTVEDTEITLEDISRMFGEEVAKIIDGLTKIDELSVSSSTAQAETLKKILLTLTDDVRVILIKLADRLHNMRTLDSMPREKQLKIASETLFIYAPLAFRLGLYSIKSELEELAFKYSQPAIYHDLTKRILAKKTENDASFQTFKDPIEQELQKLGYKFQIKLHQKTAASIWQKMKTQEVSFDDIYNTYSVDVIVGGDAADEKVRCWVVYSIITGIYKPNNKRLRDWISTPKANGYEAIHCTVMGQRGNWVDLHIRSTRMDEIANKGYAAYWKYKETTTIDASLENWLKRTQLLLLENDDNTLDFINDFKKNLFAEEIFVFTPKGELINMPQNATVLDFAYSIHTDVGNTCIGANINHKLVSIDHKLKSGDQVEVITSKIQKPRDDWYKNVVTARAKSRIKEAIRNDRKTYKVQGMKKLDELLKQLHIDHNKATVAQILNGGRVKGAVDLYYFVAKEVIGLKELKEMLNPPENRISWMRNFLTPFSRTKTIPPTNLTEQSDEVITSGKPIKYKSDFSSSKYIASSCCNPIPGDNVMGLLFPNEPIQVHKVDCPKAIRLMSQYGNNIVKAKWKQEEGIKFLAGLNIKAVDNIGFIHKISTIITEEFHINIRSFDLQSTEGLIELNLTVYIDNTETLKKLIQRLRKTEEIIKIIRLEKIT
jgi:GTP pyrophosphokinase